jgi:hypothetical protein
MTHHGHGIWVAAVVIGVVCNVALNAENNDSRIMFVSKKQYVNVISGIINQSNKAASNDDMAGKILRTL